MAKSAGASNVITDVTETTPGIYEVTVTDAVSLGAVQEVDLYDLASNFDIILNNGILYRSESVFETVVAP
jgi:hypothetical protein